MLRVQRAAPFSGKLTIWRRVWMCENQPTSWLMMVYLCFPSIPIRITTIVIYYLLLLLLFVSIDMITIIVIIIVIATTLQYININEYQWSISYSCSSHFIWYDDLVSQQHHLWYFSLGGSAQWPAVQLSNFGWNWNFFLNETKVQPLIHQWKWVGMSENG